MKTALIAEDNTEIAETYKVFLEVENYQVTVVYNGEECIKAYDEKLAHTTLENSSEPNKSDVGGKSPFDIVILDYDMPYQNGIDVAKHIRSCAPLQKILIASSFPIELFRKELESLDKSIKVLIKPFELEMFGDMVSSPPIEQTRPTLNNDSALLVQQTCSLFGGVGSC